MKKITKNLSKLTKIFLVLLMLTSHFMLPIQVLADELDEQQQEPEQQEIEPQLETEQQELEQQESMQEEQEISLENSLSLENEEDLILNENSINENEEDLISDENEDSNETGEGEEESPANYKIYINDVEQIEDNFTLEDGMSKILKIKSEYTSTNEFNYNPAEFMELDFTNRLYGVYSYALSVSNTANNIENILDERTITISNLGDNNEIINTNNIYYHNNTYYILGDTSKNLTVEDILLKFNQNLVDYNAKLEVYDQEDNLLLLNTDEVLDGYKLNLTANYTDYDLDNTINEVFNLKIVTDLNQDNIIDNKDLQILLLEESLDNVDETKEVLNIVDLTNLLIEEPVEESLDRLTSTFEYNKNVFLDEEVVISYYLEGFNLDVLKGIEGLIKYDKNILELYSIEINSSLGGFNEDGQFIYLLDDYKENGLFMTFKFKPLEVGTTNITIENIIGATGTIKGANLDTNSFDAEINILERGIGGDVEDGEDEKLENSQEEEKEETTQNLNATPNKNYYVKPIVLSGDNFIKSLIIKNYEINFNKDTLEYEIQVKNKVKDLDLEIVLNHNNAKYEVIGNNNFKAGENTVKIVVTAENGNERTYTIKVKKEKEEVLEEELEEENESSNSSKAVIIFLIIAVIIGLVYVIFKDDEEK